MKKLIIDWEWMGTAGGCRVSHTPGLASELRGEIVTSVAILVIPAAVVECSSLRIVEAVEA